jgi:hypothetical protein
MASKSGEITEEEVALLVVEIAAEQADGIASYNRLRREIPKRYSLSAADLHQSITRPNEAMWEQKMRNIKSHFEVVGNFIYEGYLEHVPRVGYRVTTSGRNLLKRHAA